MGRGTWQIAFAGALLCAPAAAQSATYGYCADDQRRKIVSTLFTVEGEADLAQLTSDWESSVATALNVRREEVRGRCLTGADRTQVESLYRVLVEGIDEYLIVFAPRRAAHASGTQLEPVEYRRMLQSIAEEKQRQRTAAQQALADYQARALAHAEALRRQRAAAANYQSKLSQYRAEMARRSATRGR